MLTLKWYRLCFKVMMLLKK